MPQQALRYLAPVDPGSSDFVIIGDLDGVHIFQGQHAAGAQGAHHARYVHIWIVGKILVERLGVRGLQFVVDFFI
jgi:hypothetical protein